MARSTATNRRFGAPRSTWLGALRPPDGSKHRVHFGSGHCDQPTVRSSASSMARGTATNQRFGAPRPDGSRHCDHRRFGAPGLFSAICANLHTEHFLLVFCDLCESSRRNASILVKIKTAARSGSTHSACRGSRSFAHLACHCAQAYSTASIGHARSNAHIHR